MEIFKKGFSKFIGKIFRSRYTFVFVNGFLLASILYFYSEDNYEKKLFESLASYVKNKSRGTANYQEALLLNSLHVTYSLCENRSAIFGNKGIHSFKSSVIHPVTYDLMTSDGACGSYSYVLSRLLNELKIPNRIAQMKVNGFYGGHILVEAKAANDWVVMDGSYNLYFKKPNGVIASFNDVQRNWSFYRNQLPANYNLNYNYGGVRYTNWEKVPVMMPVIRKILSLAIGKEKANKFSFRTYILRKFHILFELTIYIHLLLLIIFIRNYLRRSSNRAIRYFSILFSRKRSLLIVMAESKSKCA